jgi:molecular chaperone HtpG
MQKGNIGVTTENIFPIIKKFLYSDHEIFLREVVSNAVDASQKLKTLASVGDYKGELGEMKVTISINSKAKTLTISDNGIGMTAEEIEKYINQIAFSGAEEFLEKYKNDANAIIGHFGLGFYSTFMVSKQVDIITKSYQEGAESVKWSCDGSPEYTLGPSKKITVGTDIVLHIDDENKDFLEESKISGLLNKYCKFLPIPIVFGKKKEWKEDKYVETEEDNQINDTKPAWTRKPADLTEEDYMKFYKDLYPMSEDPLFHIHLNVDYPFNLTGILYFPKIKNSVEIQKNKIQLYCNQVFVTDSVEGIVPEFLTLMHGVIDSPDIPLNVSRSYLQSDSNVKKISSHITKKVADRLMEIFKNDRTQFESKWNDLKIFIEYGILTDDKFWEKAEKFCLLKNMDEKCFTIEEYKTLIAENQTNKEGQLVFLYASDKDAQHSYIDSARAKGYDVLLMDGQLDVHFVGKLEQQLEKCRFVRVDSDVADNLILKQDKPALTLNETEQENLKTLFTGQLPILEKTEFKVQFENLGELASPVVITLDEFMRRMQEMAAMNPGFNFYGEMPTTYSLVVNADHPLVKKFLTENPDHSEKAKQLIDLALLSNGLLKGEALTNFVKRSINLID